MNNPLGVSPSKGNQGTTGGKEKSFDFGENRTRDLRIRSTVTLPTELRGRTEKAGNCLVYVYQFLTSKQHQISQISYFHRFYYPMRETISPR